MVVSSGGTGLLQFRERKLERGDFVPSALVLVLSSHFIKNMTWRGGVMGWRWETKWRTRSESYVYTRARKRGAV